MEARAAALELADEVLRAFHGDACARVGALLLKHADGLTLRDLRRRLPDQPDVATALVALLQHGEGRARIHQSTRAARRSTRWICTRFCDGRARPQRYGRCDGIPKLVLK